MRLSATLVPKSIGDAQREARWMEGVGFDGAWVAEGRLRRDAVTTLALAAAATERMRLASGLVPMRTRNVSTLAITWKTLHQLAPGRMGLGLGTWWEPIASRTGLRTASPLTAMREVVAVLRGLFRGETVTLRGEYVQVDGIRFDGDDDEAGARHDIPIHLGAVGPKMLRLAGEIADGVLLDFFVPPSYAQSAMAELADDADRAGRDLADVVRPQLVACFVDDDVADAERAARLVLTRYLAQQPHVAKHEWVDPDLVARIRARCTWPATAAELASVADLVPLDLVRSVAAVGRVADVVDRLHEYLDAGCTEIVLSPFAHRRADTLASVVRAVRGVPSLSVH
ncbi:5,10-methylenetetrahydromethanopterin reductase [Actinokineospora soli]